MTYLEGTDLYVYLRERNRERRLRTLLAGFLWLMAGVMMLVLLWLA